MAEDTGFFLKDNVAHVPLESIIPAEKVLERWSLELHQLAQRVKQGEIKAYQLSSTRISPNTGATVHICVHLDCILDGYTCELNGKCVFDLKDVEEFEAGHPELTWPVVAQAPDSPASRNAETPEDFVALLRSEGIHDQKELAAQLDNTFPGKLSDSALGKLLPADPGRPIGWDAQNSQGRRLRGKKK